jgi:hypothetical protein
MTPHAFDCGAEALCMKCGQHGIEHRYHAPTCPYHSKKAARGNAVADCNCKEDWNR